MANKVFANGLEISCKVSKGKSVAAFPDPCWSPPSPPAGPIVIPYANTAYAKDLANGSTSVLISGKPIAKKDKSYFKTSTGNEAATKSFGQGLITATTKGKAYYVSWSMNVMVEGYNVARHTDLMTHNHESNPPNTGAWAFLSSAEIPECCKDDTERVEEKCKPPPDDQSKSTWKHHYCKAIAVKPCIQSLTAAVRKLLKIKDKKFEKLFTNTNDSNGLSVKEKYLYGMAKCVFDLCSINEINNTAIDIIKNKLEKVLSCIDTKNNKELKETEEYKKMVNDLNNQADNMSKDANDCIKAMRCKLSSYKNDSNNDFNVNQKGGCCPGQTGHHLVPGAWVKSKCTGYDHNKAPVVCTEGISHSYGGSHQRIHDALDRLVHDHIKDKKSADMEEIIKMVAQSHSNAFPEQCNSKCIKKQLKECYGSLECEKITPDPIKSLETLNKTPNNIGGK